MHCIGRTKSFKRCELSCKFLFCNKHNYQKWIVISFLLITLIPTSFTYFNIWEKFSNNKTVTQKDILSLKKTFEERFQEFKIPDINSEAEYAGASVALVLALHHQPQVRRKYIFDIAESEVNNRLSLFLDANNVLVFELIDNIGEIYNVKMPSNSYEFDKFMMLYCEYGTTDEFSFLRVFKNNTILEQTKFKFKINLPRENQRQGTVMADINGQNNTAMTASFYAILKSTLGKTKRRGLFNTIKWYLQKVNNEFNDLDD
jgi:hypothetical protein